MNTPDDTLWTEKYQVTEPDQFVFHQPLVKSLVKLGEVQQFVNIIFYGPFGSGKLSLARLLIYQLFKDKPNVELIFSPQQKDLNLSLDMEISFKRSPYHYEVDLEDYEFNKHIIQKFITDIAENHHFGQSYQVILFYNMESLSTDIQFTLRRTLEMYSDCCRFIFVCHRLSCIEDAIKSRCCMIRVPTPPSAEIEKWAFNIVQQYQGWKLEKNEVKTLLRRCKGNLHLILYGLQYLYYREWQFKETREVMDGDDNSFASSSMNLWDEPNIDDIFQQDIFIQSVVKSLEDIQLDYIHNLRNNIYVLLSNDTPVHDIFRKTVSMLLASKKLKEPKKEKIVTVASYFLKNLRSGYRQIYHLEGFFLAVYNILKFDLEIKT